MTSLHDSYLVTPTITKLCRRRIDAHCDPLPHDRKRVRLAVKVVHAVRAARLYHHALPTSTADLQWGARLARVVREEDLREKEEKEEEVEEVENEEEEEETGLDVRQIERY